MTRAKFARLSLLLVILFGCAAVAGAEDISGTITSTWTIFDDSRLVGDVKCEVESAPCISFGASGITLKLDGFTITGRAEPPANCATPAMFVPEDGVSAVGQNDVSITGPGLIQKFRRHGIFLNAASGVSVRRLVSHHNCFSGLLMSVVSNSEVMGVVSVRNGSASEQLPCGGNCITNSHNNRILRNVFGGNGSVSGSNGNNDFGAGLVGTSSGNLLQENTITGNTNGILIQAGANGNVIQRNIVAGNPPVQVSKDYGAGIGFDIRDFAPAGVNMFDGNLCLTYAGAETPPPCPNIPNHKTHKP